MGQPKVQRFFILNELKIFLCSTEYDLPSNNKYISKALQELKGETPYSLPPGRHCSIIRSVIIKNIRK